MSGNSEVRRRVGRPRRASVGITLSIMVLALTVVSSGSATAQQRDDSGKTDAGPARGLSLPLPLRLPDGRRIRPIAFYQSQAPELVPPDYRPVSLDRLREVLQASRANESDDRASRLQRAVYFVRVVDGMLVSERSVIDIETDREGIVRRSLGKINLAIDDGQRRIPGGLDSLPRLESDAAGDHAVVFRAGPTIRSGIEFKWRLRGTSVGTGHDFTLKLPACPQTRIALAAPSELTVETMQGVLRSRPGPPPDASEFISDSNTRWYEIDAGGLTSVKISTRRKNQASESNTLVVRQGSIDYSLDRGGLTWDCSMAIQIAPSGELPPLLATPSAVTSIQINGVNANYRTNMVDDLTQQISIEGAGQGYLAKSGFNTIRIVGKGQWDQQAGWCELPIPIWTGNQVLHAGPVHTMQLAVPDSLQLFAWELPRGWNRLPSQQVEEATVHVSEGPPIAKPETGKLFSFRNKQLVGSRIRVAARPAIVSGETLLRMDLSSGPLQAKARMSLGIDPQRMEPVSLEIDRGWTLESVIIPASGREIEVSSLTNSDRELVIWPEARDIGDSKLVIEATGSYRLGVSNSVPPTWFVRAARAHVDLTVAVMAPPNLNWSGETALRVQRVELDSLTDKQRQFFASVDNETLLFRPETGQTPQLSLQRPGVSFDVATVLQFERDGAEVIESLIIDPDAESQVLASLTVQTGPANGRPVYRWFLQGPDGSPPISLPSPDVSGRSAEGDYTIELADQNLRDRQLVGRRRYTINGDLVVQLPSVPKAASQSSEVNLGLGLIVKGATPSVQRIPVVGPQVDAAPLGDSNPQGPRSMQRLNATTRLRYDAVKQPSIVLASSDRDPNVTIVYREEIRVIASSRGTDRIEATYDVSAAGPFQIDYDPELQLAALFRDGESIDLITIPQRPISLQLSRQRETIRVVWNRNQIGSAWFRSCRIPRITASGAKIQSDYHLVASSDTFAPASLLQSSGFETDQIVAVSPDEVTTLVRRNIALALGWLLAAVVFAVFWYVSQRKPAVTAVAIVLLITTAGLWWPWHLAIIGWTILPATAAALLVTATAWSSSGSRLLPQSAPAPRDEDASSGSVEPGSASHSYSIASVAKTIGLLIWLAATLGSAIWSQEPNSEQDDRPPNVTSDAANFLIPVDPNGQLAGTVIYIPKDLKSKLFRENSRQLPQDARIESARYSLKLDSNRRADESNLTQVQADFVIHIDDRGLQSNLVRLPIDADTVSRGELIGELNRILPTDVDADGRFLTRLPAGSSFQIRLTMNPKTTRSEGWEKIRLDIPPVASSRLTVDSDQNIDAVRVGGAKGHLLEERDLRLWVEEIGPVDSLKIDYQRPDRGRLVVSRPLVRRYWLNVSKRQMTVECQVVPQSDAKLGQTVSLIILDERVPTLISDAWALVSRDATNPARQSLVLESLDETPGPIRFLWTSPIDLVDESAESLLVEIPEVIAAASGENSESWIALDYDREIRVAPVAGELTDSLSVDHFMASWSGYRGSQPQRAMISAERLPTIELARQPATPPSVDSQHHLHVTAGQLQLRYSATLRQGSDPGTPRTLSLPADWQLIDLKVDGRRVDAQPIRVRARGEVALGTIDENAETKIEVSAVRRLTNRLLTLPTLTLSPVIDSSDLYTVTRQRGIVLRPISDNSQLADQPPETSAASLAKGWIPYRAWRTSSQASDRAKPPPPRKFRVVPQVPRFDCHQWISLSWSDGQWNMDARVRFDGDKLPDYIDVEIPTRWCDSAEVLHANVWTRQPAIDDSLQILRIQCDPTVLADKTVRIRSRLDDAEKGRVVVPKVNVLGAGRRNIQISVPNRLTNEAISWRTSVVEVSDVDPLWTDYVDASEERSTFSVANTDWSVELAPLPPVDTSAVALTSDAQVFPQSDAVLVVCRWDLIPGGLSSVSVELPLGATCVGAWTAGRAVVAEPDTELEQQGERERNVVKLPLSLSRLAQPVEVLIRVPSGRARQADYLPELLQIPVPQRWLSTFSPVTSMPRRTEQDMKSEHALAIARSVVESVDQSFDSLAERPKDEIAVWLKPWLERYRQIAESQGHRPNWNASNNSSESGVTEAALQPSSMSLTERWQKLDSRMSVHVTQYLGKETAETEAQPLLRLSQLEGYQLQNIKRVTVSDRAVPIETVSTGGQGLRTMIVNCLTLVLVCGVLACVWPLRQRADKLLVHPAFWLGLVGVLGFFVAPVPVAAAIVLTAVALPVFPARASSLRSR